MLATMRRSLGKVFSCYLLFFSAVYVCTTAKQKSDDSSIGSRVVFFCLIAEYCVRTNKEGDGHERKNEDDLFLTASYNEQPRHSVPKAKHRSGIFYQRP